MNTNKSIQDDAQSLQMAVSGSLSYEDKVKLFTSKNFFPATSWFFAL